MKREAEKPLNKNEKEIIVILIIAALFFWVCIPGNNYKTKIKQRK